MSVEPLPTRSHAWLRLSDCVACLDRGPWKFIQLRGGALSTEAIDGDDVDLLGTRESVGQLLRALFARVRAGDCHLRVRAASRSKTEVTIISTDGKHQLELDLWIELWQINNRTRCLRHELAAPLVCNPAAAIQRLPAHLEAAIYVHHLISKRKNLTDGKPARRLAEYAAQCRASGRDQLAVALEGIIANRRIDNPARSLAEAIVAEELKLPDPGAFVRRWRKLRDGFRAAWFGAPRRASVISLMGCDGSGKTTMAHEMAKRRTDVEGVFTGKHLFRKSILYKLLVIFIRPLLFQDREKFDETFAPLAYVRACLGLQFKLWRRKRGLLIVDRALADFLFVGRKTDRPEFCRSRWLSRLVGRRIPTVHFVLPFERVQERKQEMTRAGHEIYDQSMFEHFVRQSPVDYVVFDNQSDLPAAAAALDRIVGRLQKNGVAD
jgi:hypothetical protein